MICSRKPAWIVLSDSQQRDTITGKWEFLYAGEGCKYDQAVPCGMEQDRSP
jgi:hypothetical protein